MILFNLENTVLIEAHTAPVVVHFIFLILQLFNLLLIVYKQRILLHLIAC